MVSLTGCARCEYLHFRVYSYVAYVNFPILTHCFYNSVYNIEILTV